MKKPILSRRLSESILKEAAQVGRRAESGAPANLFETQIGLLQQGANPVQPAANDFDPHAGLEPAAEALLQVGAGTAHVGQHVFDADARRPRGRE
jgi:hypothetical protein